jgi:cytidylate kinase/anti-sigma regulatory factor (Ser/Thr protein kinase)
MMHISVVGISHTVGAGGDETGRSVAERLGFRFVDEEVISTAAEKAGIEPDLVADTEKRKGFLVRFVDSLGMSGGTASVAYLPDLGEAGRSEDFRALIREAVAETAERGQVVIASHAASIALAGRNDLLRVLVTASPATRARRVSELAGVGQREAEKAVKEQDAARADYLRRFYRVDRELPTHYDLVVNTDALSTEQAAEVVARAARSRQRVQVLPSSLSAPPGHRWIAAGARCSTQPASRSFGFFARGPGVLFRSASWSSASGAVVEQGRDSGEMELLLTLPADVRAPRMVRGALEAFAPVFPPAFVDDARLCANELVSNAIKHGGLTRGDQLEIWARGSRERLRVEVVGGSRRFDTEPRRPSLDETSGWGLVLVGALSNRWGYYDGRDTTVWFEIDRVRRLSTEPLPPEVVRPGGGWNGILPGRRRSRSGRAAS